MATWRVETSWSVACGWNHRFRIEKQSNDINDISIFIRPKNESEISTIFLSFISTSRWIKKVKRKKERIVTATITRQTLVRDRIFNRWRVVVLKGEQREGIRVEKYFHGGGGGDVGKLVGNMEAERLTNLSVRKVENENRSIVEERERGFYQLSTTRKLRIPP